MRKFLLAALLAILPGYAQASLDLSYARKAATETTKMLKELLAKPKEQTIIFDENTKFFLDGKQIKELPSPKGIVVVEIKVNEKGVAVEIHFATEQ